MESTIAFFKTSSLTEYNYIFKTEVLKSCVEYV
jgi:hypothetical protein